MYLTASSILQRTDPGWVGSMLGTGTSAPCQTGIPGFADGVQCEVISH